MVSSSRIEGGGAQVLSAGVRKTIQSIKEIVGNHSDADIYVALKETNMDPNETTQKLLNQDPFHEVKRKRDRKKENQRVKSSVAPEPQNQRFKSSVAAEPQNQRFKSSAAAEPQNQRFKSSTAVEPRKISEFAQIPPPEKQPNAYIDRNARRGGFNRNSTSVASREFRVVRDNRVNQNSDTDLKPAQNSTSTREKVISNRAVKSTATGVAGHQKPPVVQHSSKALDGPADSQPRQTKGAASGGNDAKESLEGKRIPSPAAPLVQTKANDPQLNSTNASNSSVVGVYSSSLDPVHVPSLHSRPAANVGAIRREVGVVGPRRQSSENPAKPSSSQSTSLPKMTGPKTLSPESTGTVSGISKSDQPSQNVAPQSATPAVSASRPFSSGQSGNRPHHLMGHQKASQPNKEWKPKSSLKLNANGPGVIGTHAKTVSPPSKDLEDMKQEDLQIQDSISGVNIVENQNVILAAHIRVSETDRSRLTFGSLGTELGTSVNSVSTTSEGIVELSTKTSERISISDPESSGNEPASSKQLNDSVQSSGPSSPASGNLSDHQLTEQKESSSPRNLGNSGDVEVVRDTTNSLQQQDTSELPSFSGYNPHMTYDASYFHSKVDETVRGPGLQSPQEVVSSHTTNMIPASTMAVVQQQQQLAQMYPQLHVSHFSNLMPYRQYLSPVYVPQMSVPGYSNNPSYPHPPNGSSYVLMPGNSSHLTPGSLKYGIHQFKPAPNGNPTGFGNFTSPAGYAINTPGVVGSTVGHEDSSRLKYKDSFYVPNPQAETSEIWMNPRDIPNMQSASYYNMPGQTPHPYMPSHGGHATFNAAAQSSHMQFPGMYHPAPQPAGIPSPHHMGPAIGGNVGVGVPGPSPGAQVGAYQQQPQMGHINWTGNF